MKEHSRTWQGNASYDTVTIQSLFNSCQLNIRAAAQEERRLQELYDRLPPGDRRLVGTKDEPPLAYKILVAGYDQKHWREYAEYYRARMEREGANGTVRIPLPRRFALASLDPEGERK